MLDIDGSQVKELFHRLLNQVLKLELGHYYAKVGIPITHQRWFQRFRLDGLDRAATCDLSFELLHLLRLPTSNSITAQRSQESAMKELLCSFYGTLNSLFSWPPS